MLLKQTLGFRERVCAGKKVEGLTEEKKKILRAKGEVTRNYGL